MIRFLMVLFAVEMIAVGALLGPLKSLVPTCPVTFGFCYERGVR